MKAVIVATTKPFAMVGTARPRKSARRLAGEASRTGRVWKRRSPAIAWPMPKRPVTDAATKLFPITKNVSSATFAARPR